MKIGLVSPYDWAHPGGVGVHIQQLSKEFTRQGHQVKIIAPSSKPLSELSSDNLIIIGRPIPVPISGSIARITLSFHRAPQVQQVLEEERFDVVHIHEPLFPALPLTVLRYSNALNVGTFHAYTHNPRHYRSMRPLIKRWFRRLHGKIAVSPPAAATVGKYFPGFYNIIPNGIDLDHFSSDAAPIARFKDGMLNILFVGRMEKRKGLQHLLAAYSRIKWEYPQVRLIVVGPGKLDSASERILGERALKDVEFIGGVDYKDLPSYYRTADIYCSPATGSESFGIVLLEALAAGAPLVASDIPGYASVVEHGKHGLLVKPQDDQALANALLEMINNPAMRQAMAERGRAHAQQFSWPLVAARVQDYYERILGERHPGRPFTGR